MSPEVQFIAGKSNVSLNCLLFDFLMHLGNCYPKLKYNPNISDLQQLNAVELFLTSNKPGAHLIDLNDFEAFTKHFCNLLWEIDDNYKKLKMHQFGIS